jgi:7-cyano-7-deazaguanine synthase
MRSENNKRVAVLYSGGLDSLITAWLYYINNYELTLIHFNYGQKASELELDYTKRFAEKINANLIILDARNLFSIFSSHSLLLSKDNITPETLKEAESDVNYVPMRNLILLSYAGAICEINNINKLAYGANLTESGNYPDNSIRFKEYLDKVFKVSGKQNYQLELKAPLINLTKTEIVALGIYYGAPLELSISCYYPTIEQPHCGVCGSCLLRKSAFERLGYKNEITGANVTINDKVIETVETIMQANAIEL